METNKLSTSKDNEKEQLLLKAKIESLQQQLNVIEQKTISFENVLRSNLEDEIIEVQELTVLYKKLQKEKKEKRLIQKKRGKNYKEVEGLKIVSKKRERNINVEDKKEIKRLYREAMLCVHPDKFSMNEDKQDLATEITTKLIDIYQSGNLQRLKKIHTHILSGNALMQFNSSLKSEVETSHKDTYLQEEVEALEKQLVDAKNKHTYKVLTDYENPLNFVTELKTYYVDRIFKLKKRTRKANTITKRQ